MSADDNRNKEVAQQCTLLIAQSGVSKEDSLLIVLNMLNYHSGLVIGSGSIHAEFIAGVKSHLQQAIQQL